MVTNTNENKNVFTIKACKRDGGKWINEVKRFIGELEFGQVVITVHQQKVVQVEKTEKLRF
jgi:hypothetical protein